MKDEKMAETIGTLTRVYDDDIDCFEKEEWQIAERRLLAAILQRALVDLLQMFERPKRVQEVESGEFDAIDAENRDKQMAHPGGYRGRKYKAGFQKKWQARELIRWFKSKDESELSLIWILKNLNLEGVYNKIQDMVDNDTIEDYPEIASLRL